MEHNGFEKKLEALEALVKKMETGGLTLEETLTCYEQGVALEKELTAALDGAQKRMMELTGDGQQKPMDDMP